jgi:hypothetical protein
MAVSQGPDPDEKKPRRKKSGNARTAQRAKLVEKAIEKIEAKLGAEDVKATFADFIRLLQLQKELQADQPQEIKVTWVEPADTEPASGD